MEAVAARQQMLSWEAVVVVGRTKTLRLGGREWKPNPRRRRGSCWLGQTLQVGGAAWRGTTSVEGGARWLCVAAHQQKRVRRRAIKLRRRKKDEAREGEGRRGITGGWRGTTVVRRGWLDGGDKESTKV